MAKYPRTQHVEGSKLQAGDEDLTQVRFSDLLGKRLVIEEKMDGANCAVSFDDDASLKLQSRGHYLRGGPRELHWDLFKRWAACHEQAFFDTLGDRYVMYGEWMYAKHTVFYDLLPHYFLEFDVLDRETGLFLSTSARRSLLNGLPVVPVLVLHDGHMDSLEQMRGLVRQSYFKTGLWRTRLRTTAASGGLDPERVSRETDGSDLMEGLYIKVEDDASVIQRLKWVRADFTNKIIDAETHWLDRPIIPNSLMPGVDVFRQSP